MGFAEWRGTQFTCVYLLYWYKSADSDAATALFAYRKFVPVTQVNCAPRVTGTKVQIVTQLLRSLRTGNVSLHHAWRHRQPAGTSSLRPHTLVA